MARHRILRTIAVAVALVVAASGLVYSVGAAPASTAVAAPAGAFDPANIISDTQFFDSASMSEQAIQQFIQSQNCSPRDGVPCLKDYRESTPTKGQQGAGHCTQYTGAANESAARIIAKVAQACRISPKVLLVLMQKEQSLLTNPSAYGYERTMGWGCPDTSACNALYFGFFNQVYRSAWQFREYTQNPGEWRYRMGQSYVQYHPNADCGGTVLTIRNQATANLYNYTPYQPNAAALANLYGTGDACSAYGNRNFWRMFYDWFGSPTELSPIGYVENLQPMPGGVGIWGWALDGDTSNPIQVQVNLNGALLTTVTANVPRPDVNDRYGLGANHGYSIQVGVPNGLQNICVFGINVGSGSHTPFGCWTVRIGGNPIGQVENIAPQPGGLGVWGWTLDPDSAAPIGVQVFVDGVFAGGGAASTARADVGASRPGYGNNHGFGLVVKASPGSHRVCVYGINVGAGSNTELGCYTATAGGSPIGTIDYITTGPGTVSAYGWAVDPDTTDPISVQLNLDGAYLTTIPASSVRSNFGIMTAFGANHGFGTKVAVPNGKHQLCAWGLNVQSGGHKILSCNDIEVGGPPVGAIENGVAGFGSVTAYGWAYDRDTVDPIQIQVNIDDKNAGTGTANVARPDLANTIPGDYGTTHGYGVTVQAAPGPHRVCVWGINQGYGAHTQLGCFTTTVSGDPVGKVEFIGPFGGNLGVYGYAFDPDTSEPIAVHVYMDGVFAGGTVANVARPDIAPPAARYGINHGYGVQFPASPGTHQICTYAINTGYGVNTLLSCNTATK